LARSSGAFVHERLLARSMCGITLNRLMATMGWLQLCGLLNRRVTHTGLG
jgi:hypothetical protein